MSDNDDACDQCGLDHCDCDHEEVLSADKSTPTLSDWREAWETESDEGRRQTISWEEAERRYHELYPDERPYEPYR